MKSVYVRENLIITEFDKEDVITASEPAPTPEEPPISTVAKRENVYRSFSSFDGPGSWF